MRGQADPLACRMVGCGGATRIRKKEIWPMRQAFDQLSLRTEGQGLYEIIDRVGSWVAAQGIAAGLLTVYLHHPSASLLIQENADPDVLRDLGDFFRRIVPEDPRHYRHTLEGPDDMPAHI